VDVNKAGACIERPTVIEIALLDQVVKDKSAFALRLTDIGLGFIST
jgi:hypothetical protein